MASGSPSSLPPGFRFHPTDEELILHYLRKRAAPPFSPVPIIADVDIYRFNPWDLPEKAKFGDREWYFFSPRDRKYPNGVRPNRTAASGYWKATGTDKPITASKGNGNIGVKKALVFYKGKPPKGVKTNWIMHEFRLLDSLNRSSNRASAKHKEDNMRLDDWVLCRIYQKASHQPSVGVKGQEEHTIEESIAKNSSFSLSELLMIEDSDLSLLSRLLETPLITTAPYQATVLSATSSLCFTSQAMEDEGNSSKQQRIAANCHFDECGCYLNSSMKQLNTSSQIYGQLVNQFDLSQTFFYQQTMLNSQLGMP